MDISVVRIVKIVDVRTNRSTVLRIKYLKEERWSKEQLYNNISKLIKLLLMPVRLSINRCIQPCCTVEVPAALTTI